MKIALTDVETTGLDPRKHEIVEIACLIFDAATCEILDQLEMKVMPMRIGDADPIALKVNGYKADEWIGARTLKDAMLEYGSRTAGCAFMAYNVGFDWGFMQQAFLDAGVVHGLQRYKLDLLTMAWAKLYPMPKTFPYSMKSACEALHIPPEPAVHRAMNGVRAEYEIYRKVKKHAP